MRRLADEHRLGREKDLLQLELCWLDQLQTYKFGGSRPRSVRNLFCFGTVLLLKGELPEVVAFSCCALYMCVSSISLLSLVFLSSPLRGPCALESTSLTVAHWPGDVSIFQWIRCSSPLARTRRLGTGDWRYLGHGWVVY